MRTWWVGKFKVTEVQEMPIAVGLLDGLIAEATPLAVRQVGWLYPDFVNQAGQTLWDIHAYVVDTGEQVILVDPGCGNGKNYPLQPTWSGLDTPFLDRLADAGYRRDDIDIILCTHLHLDHIGWCSMQDGAGRWIPTFPNSRLVVGKDEYEHYSDLKNSADDENPNAVAYPDSDPSIPRQMKLVWEETLAPVIDSGRFELVPSGAEIVEGVRYESTPGHTLGHQSVRLKSGDDSAFITGDFIHHPVQIARSDWSSRGDWDGDVSARNRRAFLESCVGSDLLILGTHFTGIGAGHIVEDGEGFRLVAAKPTTRGRVGDPAGPPST